MRETYPKALEFVLRWEGGFSNHPADRGGRTFAGISEAAHPDVWDDGVVTEDEVEHVYRTEYWERIQGDDLPYPVDMVALDYAVHSGVARTVRELQRIVGTRVDGVLGPRTLEAVHRHDPDVLAKALLGVRAVRLQRIADRRPSQSVFLRGWMRRVADLERTAS